ncbi:MAG: ABC transporter family substrate-binding protein [Segniliparus sp.]|uniref:ABC transporter family substrate-binding protein n=1 Tax=Segniliparus sp. TaxID=2804064 RepID=UPI003F36CBC6
MIPRRSLLLGLAGLPLASLYAASCGLPLRKPSSSDDPLRAADPETLRQGGVFRWPVDDFPKNFNALQADMSGYTRDIVAPCMPVPFRADSRGNLTRRDEYFTAIGLEPGEPQTVVYTINPEARWSDGTLITWEDLHWQWRALSGADERYLVASTTGYRDIAHVGKGVDERQAVVVFARPYADWRKLFGLLYPKTTNNDPDVFNKGWIFGRGGLRIPPVTSGPFKIGPYDEDQGRIAMVPDPHWWGRAPRLDSLVFLGLPKEAQIGALQNGEIDYMNLLASAPALAVAENTKGLDIRPGPSSTISALVFCGRDGSICADRGLRRAVAKGIDRDRIAATLIGSVSASPAAAYNLVFLRSSTGYGDHREALPYDPRAARAELAALGYRRPRIRFVIPAQNPTGADIGKILQQMLAEIDVDLVIEPVPSAEFFRSHINVGDFDLTTFRTECSPYPSDSAPTYGRYRTARGEPDVQQNYGQIGSERLNQLLDQMQAELDPGRMRQIANAADREIAEIAHSLPLFETPYNYAVRSAVRNFGASGVGDMDHAAIGYAPDA